MLTNREIATLILIAAFIAWALSQATVRKTVPALLRSLTNIKILVIIGAYLTYAILLIGVAKHFGLWDVSLLKDTVEVVMITGLGMVFSANVTKSGTALTRNTVRDVIGIAAVVSFYVNLSSFNILAELVIQGLFAILGALAAVAKYQKDIAKTATKMFDVLLGIGGIFLLVKTTSDLNEVWHAEGASGVFGPLLISIWFPLFLLPFVYSLSFLMHLETITLGLEALNNRKRIGLRSFLAMLLGLQFSVKYARCFTGHWRQDFLERSEFRHQIRIMGAYRESIRKHEAEVRQEARTLKKYAGVEGSDEQGRRLDRREFKETHRLLTDLYHYQRGMYVNRGHYFEQPLILLNDSKYYGLERHDDLAVTAQVSSNKQSWYAWRQTPSGWFFAIGGSKDAEKQWRYDGATPPASYPSSNSRVWTAAGGINWAG